MNYLKKCIISALEADIYNSDSYDVGIIIGETVKHLANNKVEGCDSNALIEGINKGFQRADVKEITQWSNECD